MLELGGLLVLRFSELSRLDSITALLLLILLFVTNYSARFSVLWSYDSSESRV